MKNADEEMISVKEAQQMLNVNKKCLYKMISTGEIITYKVGSQLKVNMESVKVHLSYMDRNRKAYTFGKNITSSEVEMISDWT